MARRPILIAPDPLLKRPARFVDRVDREVQQLADDLLETMYDANGIGLAATQLGALQRVIVVDVAREEQRRPLVMVNPEILAFEGDPVTCEEGCLSFPGAFAEVERPARATVRYLDLRGRSRTRDYEGLEGVCIQHEIDHLEGVLFIDHLRRFRRQQILRTMARHKRELRQRRSTESRAVV